MNSACKWVLTTSTSSSSGFAGGTSVIIQYIFTGGHLVRSHVYGVKLHFTDQTLEIVEAGSIPGVVVVDDHQFLPEIITRIPSFLEMMKSRPSFRVISRFLTKDMHFAAAA